MRPLPCIPVLTLVAGLWASPATATASIIASETFSYSAGSLGTASGDTGWTTNWAGGSTNVTSPGLAFSGIGSGLKLTTNNDNNGAFRSLAPQGTDGTTVWLGYLVSGTGAPVAAGYEGLSLFQDGTENLFTGKRSNQTVWGVERSGGSSGDSLMTADTATHYLVYKIEFGAGTTAGNEKITMWMDPTPGLANPDNTAVATLTDVTNFTFNRVRIQSGNGASFNADEVRLGTTFADVPEPASAVTLLVGGAALLARRRRKA
jgi:hypothetical protein